MNQDSPLPGQTGSNSKYSTPPEFWTVFFLCLFLGVFGAHRFYARKYKSAVFQLFTCGGIGFWALLDMLLILVDSFQSEKGVYYKNPNPRLAWSIVLVVLGLGIAMHIYDYKYRYSYRTNHRVTSAHLDLNSVAPPSPVTNSPVHQLIITDAQDKFGNDAVAQIEDTSTNGVYQVTVRTRDRYRAIKTETYIVTMDPAGTKVASWQ